MRLARIRCAQEGKLSEGAMSEEQSWVLHQSPMQKQQEFADPTVLKGAVIRGQISFFSRQEFICVKNK